MANNKNWYGRIWKARSFCTSISSWVLLGWLSDLPAIASSDEAGGIAQETISYYLKNKAGQYNGFNIIVGVMTNLYWYSNKGPGIIALKRGVFGLSNHLLDTPWPKVLRAKQMLLDLLSSDGLPPDEAFFNLLLDQTKPQDSELPDTGVGLERERILSPIFISSPVYGTRSSTLIFVDTRGNVRFVEKTHDPGAPPPTLREFQFTLDSAS